MNLSEYAARRKEVLSRITSGLEVDDRVVAAWLSGSFGRGEDDEWSDLDLHVAVADDHLQAMLNERPGLYSTAGVPLLIQEEMESDSQAGARFQLVMYPGPVEVDWNIGPESKAVRPLNFKMLVQRADLPVFNTVPLSPDARRGRAQHWITFFWAMLPIGIKLCGRRDTRRAVNQLDLQTTAYIALWRLASDRYNGELPNWANPVLEPELQALIPLVGPTITPGDVLSAMVVLADRVRELHPALRQMGVSVPEDFTKQMPELRDLALKMLSMDSSRPLRYR